MNESRDNVLMVIKTNVANGFIHLILNFLSLCFHLFFTLVLGTTCLFTSNRILWIANNFYILIEKCSMEYLNSSLCKLAPFVKSQNFVRLLTFNRQEFLE